MYAIKTIQRMLRVGIRNIAHDLLGHVARYRPDALLFQDPDAFRAIYDTKANVKKAKKYRAWARHVAAETTFTTTDSVIHARKRRVLNAAFSDKAMRSADHIPIRHIDRWCELLADSEENAPKPQWTKPKNMTEWSDYLILDILTELSFGKSFETKEPAANPGKSIPHSVVRYLKFMYPIIWSLFLDIWLWLKRRGLDRFVENNLPEEPKKKQLRRQEQRPASEDGFKDLLHHLLQADDPEGGPGFTPLELRGETELLLSAGFDTTSAVIAAMFSLPRPQRIRLHKAHPRDTANVSRA
ncbi:hypothetical protein MMC11_008390 [Xylographa trunciseda]|nr:hypothetical protein [Xylographa trunciseda]